MRTFGTLLGVMVLMAIAGGTAHAAGATALYGGNTIDIARTLDDPMDLWVAPEDLTRINGFVLKPEGACLDEICIPIKQDADNDLFVTRLGQKWINVTALARKIGQAYEFNSDENVYSFSPVPQTMSSYLDSAIAPDFALQDRAGETVRLSDFRGKKVLIVTWASW